MALGTITRPAASNDYVAGNKRVRVRDVQLTSGANYTTGGEAITPAAVGLRFRIESARVIGLAKPSGGATARTVGFDLTNPASVKIQAYNGDAGTAGPQAEVAASADLSTFTARVEFVGA